MIGKKFAHYEILEKLGSGGMGEVYRAHDLSLGREVAVKVLPVRFAGDPDRLQRFEQEARAASSLNHPNIVTIHEVGEAVGLPYIVMERLKGESLGDRLARIESLKRCRLIASRVALEREIAAGDAPAAARLR